MRYQDGLTVIEALIVLAIVGVLLALGLPALSDLVEDQQLISDSNDLFASLFTARSEAVTRNEVVSMCKIATATPTACASGSSWQSGWNIFVDENFDGTADLGEEILSTYMGMSANSAVTSAAFANSISYNPNGSSNNNGSFTICVSDNSARDILINATGRPRIADGSCP